MDGKLVALSLEFDDFVDSLKVLNSDSDLRDKGRLLAFE
jgi:hypothetical protein